MTNKDKPCGDNHFAMDGCIINDTVMQKIRNRKLNLSAIKVYMYLGRNRDVDTGILHGTPVKDIAAYWCISTRAVRRGLADLTDAGLYEPPLRGSEEVTGVLLPKRSKADE